ncbi:Lrp/AsnC family transcriptional regulator [Robiginitalea sp. SC105]|uniref:Lrp/AsnC family transcriptional regulator n=1 Tax=Robiginitalea sp. SC105 TaxID=2762332 RepID=UPI00163A8E24|nr:Lrp/AsnC family transcriptional regulator [Robiginitalea sp. SC105]MBC2840431.1 Lrp/AsnC family transcriptional regulator [Robiginitalea sp. SC105]
MELDPTDQKLLHLLQENSKQTNKALALRLGLSQTAVYERVRRLEKKGVIDRYVALLDPARAGKKLKVFCHIKLSQHIKPRVLQFEKEVLALREVVSCYHIGGEYDYILEIYVEDMEAYREFMVGKLTAINHIGSTQSSFVIREVKHTTELPL